MNSSVTPSTRLRSIDFLRGLAIVLMVQTHIWQFYIRASTPVGLAIERWAVDPLGGYAAPLFTIISGVSAQLALLSAAGRIPPRGVKVLFWKRGLFLFLLSTAVNVITTSVLHVLGISLLNWSIMQLIGFCLCLVPLFARLPWPVKLLWVAAPIVVSNLIHAEAGSFFAPLFSGFAPLFPWASLFFAGTLIGKWSSARIWTDRPGGSGKMLVGGLILIVGVGLPLHSVFAPFVPGHVAQINLTTFCVYGGCFLLLLASGTYWFDFLRRKGMVVESIIHMGQHALSLYYIQLIAIVGSAIFLKRMTGKSTSLDWIWFIPLVTAAWVGLHIILTAWRDVGYAWSLEWMLSRLAKGNQPYLAGKQRHDA